MSGTAPVGTQAVDRAALLLVAVLEASAPLSSTELVAATGLPKSTVSRLLSSLERSGLIQRTAEGAVIAGPRITDYALSVRPEDTLVRIAQPSLDRLGSLTGETVNLAVPLGGEVRQIAQVDAIYLLGAVNWLDRPVPFHCSALGRVFLAYGHPMPTGRLPKLTERTITSRSQLEREVDRVLERFEVGSVLADQATTAMRAAIRSEGAAFRRIGTGDLFRLGPAEVEVLWPPLGTSDTVPGDRNARSVVLLIRIAGRTILLTGDAEAELVPLDPGPIDVLKVAHHGSEDTGLPDFLASTGPAVALISAGEGNPYGHPVESTTSALRKVGSTTFRTDRDGSISVLVEPSGRITVEKSG